MTSQRIAAAAAILLAAAAQAATISTTWTLTNAPIALSSDFSSATVNGPITLSNIGSGTFKASVALASLFSSSSISVPYTITLSTGDTILGTLTFPASVLSGSGSGSATVTGGTGAYVGSTGSFPTLAGSGSFSGTSGSLSFSGAGTITPNGGGASGPPPNITAVLDAGSYTPSIAQGSIFVVKGTGLSASGYTPFSFPLPASSAGVSISFAPQNGGTATQAYLIYLYNQSGVNQLAAVLPSTVATGSYKVTVTNGSQTSVPFTAQVVARKPELITADGSGTGLAVIQNFVSASQLDVNRFTTGSVGGFTISPAHPGQTLIGYLVGTGADPGPDNQASPGYNFLNNGVTVQVLIGNLTIAASYEGRVAGGSGYEQVNFVLPTNVPTGCTVPFQLNVNGVLSAPTFIAIAPNATASACVQPGFTTSQLQGFDQGNIFYSGGFYISQNTSEGTESDGAFGSFIKYTGSQLSAIPASSAGFSNFPTGCTVSQLLTAQGGASGSGVVLDAGSVTLTGPSGSGLSNTLFSQLAGTYFLGIGGTGGVNAKILPGTYTLNGAGGVDVGRFTASLTLPTPLTITGGLPSVVVRNNGLPLSWTGGNAPDLVVISGSAIQVSASGAGSGASFVCFTTAGAGGFNVPSSILNQLPAISAADIGSFKAAGSLDVFSVGQPTSFSAPLTAGGSINPSYFFGSLGASDSPAYQ